MKISARSLRRWAFGFVTVALLLAGILPAGQAGAQAPELAPCGPPPPAANWTINVSCEIGSNTIAPRNVTITNNATVTIFGGRWLNVAELPLADAG